jgi:hypothetical protein
MLVQHATQRYNCTRILVGYLGAMAFLTNVVGAIPYPIQLVCPWRIPAQVANTVHKDAIRAMTAFHTWRPGTDESLKHKDMNLNRLLRRTPVSQPHPKMPIAMLGQSHHPTTPTPITPR